MNEEYDYIVLGTGLVECIISSLLSMQKKRVLHVDQNDYYGGECASLNLTQLYKKFRPSIQPCAQFGRDRDYNIDLVPKFMMANEELINVLIHTDVTRYLEFRQISGSFVYWKGDVIKVPASVSDISFKNVFFGPIEMYRIRNFLIYLDRYNPADVSTHEGFNMYTSTTSQLYDKFGLGNSAREMIGHAIALQINDDYLQNKAIDTVTRIKLYNNSLGRFGKSPYIYPLYGLSELPQGFARLSAIYGGTYMLDKKVDRLVYKNQPDTDEMVCGVRFSNGEIARCKEGVIGDPSYFPEKVRLVGKVVRAICFLQHPIRNTNNADSCQLILPSNQIGRKHDIYIACISSSHNICASGFHVAIVSTVLDDYSNVSAVNSGQSIGFLEREIKPALDLLDGVVEKFVYLSDLMVPIEDGKRDGVFISKSLDATSHFDTMYLDVANLYLRITGSPLSVPRREVQPDD